MPERSRRRAGRARVAARARAVYLARRLGIALRERRHAAGLRQLDVALAGGVSQSFISRMESGRGQDASIETWLAVATAVGSELAAFFDDAPGAARSRDYEHLKRQQLVITTAAAGGWHPSVERRSDTRSAWPGSVDGQLDRAGRRETAVVEIWDWFNDVGEAARGLIRKVTAIEREQAARELDGAPQWRVSGLIIVRGTRRNRQLLAEFGALFRAVYPASSRAWLAALTRPDAEMPRDPGLLWTDVRGTRFFAARL
jgi:transcriptional regulator with XRE-family HTH domain